MRNTLGAWLPRGQELQGGQPTSATEAEDSSWRDWFTDSSVTCWPHKCCAEHTMILVRHALCYPETDPSGTTSWAVAAGLTTQISETQRVKSGYTRLGSQSAQGEKPGGRQFGWLETQTRNMQRKVAFGSFWIHNLNGNVGNRSEIPGLGQEVSPLFKGKQLLHWESVKINVTYKRGRSIHFQSFYISVKTISTK